MRSGVLVITTKVVTVITQRVIGIGDGAVHATLVTSLKAALRLVVNLACQIAPLAMCDEVVKIGVCIVRGKYLSFMSFVSCAGVPPLRFFLVFSVGSF